jgi:hypothetical protein
MGRVERCDGARKTGLEARSDAMADPLKSAPETERFFHAGSAPIRCKSIEISWLDFVIRS